MTLAPPTRELLLRKIKTLNQELWENRVDAPSVEKWLANFNELSFASSSIERDRASLAALHLLSHFTFVSHQILTHLMRALYRDLIKYPIVEEIRLSNSHTTDHSKISRAFMASLKRKRFSYLGDGWESSAMLLYHFRTASGLPSSLFANPHDLMSGSRKRIDRVIFVDDLCGSGKQAAAYGAKVIPQIRSALPGVTIEYCSLYATDRGLGSLHPTFDRARTVALLDDSFKSLEPASRYFPTRYPEVDRTFSRRVAQHFGTQLQPNAPFGYQDAQLLLGFFYNTPNGTLPILSHQGPKDRAWNPPFPRHPKVR